MYGGASMIAFLFNRYTFLILAVVIIVVLVGAGKLVWNRYTIGGLLALALGIAVWTAYGKLITEQRAIGAQSVPGKWDAANVILKTAADKATAENKAKELAWADAAMKAKNEADLRIKTLQANATVARAESVSLRSALAAARSALSSATADSVRNYAAALSVVFDQCVGAYQELASKADGHASDTQLIMSAWPTK